MGAEQSLITISEADSVSIPGRRCFVTSPIDICDFDRLWTEIKAGLRTDFVKDPSVKSLEVTDTSEDNFDLLKIVDGAVLKAPIPEIHIKCKFFLNREKGEIYEEQRMVPFNNIKEIRVVRITRDPLRLEMMAQRVVEDHRHGPIVQTTLAAILKIAVGRDVATFPGRPSRLMPGQQNKLIVESEPLEGSISFEDLSAKIKDVLKTQEHNTFHKEGTLELKQIRKTETDDFFDVFYAMDGQKMMQIGLANKPDDQFWRCQVETSQLKGEVPKPSEGPEATESKQAATFTWYISCNSLLIDTYYMVVHGGPPLVVEMWAQSVLPHELPSLDPITSLFRMLTGLQLLGWSNMIVERTANFS